jgi:hypothetical protein
MQLSAKVAPDSPMYSWQLAASMGYIVYSTYSPFVAVISTLAAIFLYTCV